MHGSVCALAGALHDLEAAFDHAVDWSWQITPQPQHAAAREALVTAVAEVAAVLAQRCERTGERLWPVPEEGRLSRQHACVLQFPEYFYCSEPDRAEVEGHAALWLTMHSGASLTGCAPMEALAACAQAGTARSATSG